MKKPRDIPVYGRGLGELALEEIRAGNVWMSKVDLMIWHEETVILKFRYGWIP